MNGVDVGRIFCIGKNYADHVAELAHLGHAADGRCVVFMKPASAVVAPGEPIRLPRGRGAVHHEAELVVRLRGGGRDVPLERALDQVSHLSLGLDLTLRELQTTLKDKGAPWELAKSFDGSAPLGAWVGYDGRDLQSVEFDFSVNGVLKQHGNTAQMIYPVARQIQILSQSWALRDGDVIYSGTPAGVGPLTAGDRVLLEADGIGRCEWVCE